MKINKLLTVLAALALLAGCDKGAGSFRTGSTLPMWQEGWLDIHAINTGRGESFRHQYRPRGKLLVHLPGRHHDAAGRLGFPAARDASP